MAQHLEASVLDTPSEALGCAMRETLHVGDIVLEMLRKSLVAIEGSDLKLVKEVEKADDDVDSLHEAIKLYLQHSECMAFLSLHAIPRELESGTLKIIGIKKLPIHRNFYFITPQGPEGGLSSLLMRFLLRNHSF